jgi:adenylate cyclase
VEQIQQQSETERFSLSLAQLLQHARYVREKYASVPAFGAKYLEELVENASADDKDKETAVSIQEIIRELHAEAEKKNPLLTDLSGNVLKSHDEGALERISREIVFRKQIEEYYLPKQLIDAIMEIGEIPKNSIETMIGIGFIDIADYTFLSKFLSPKENQVVLNGLYTAFNWVLYRHGGYLNKIEGDSLMFHFGGIIDPNVKGLEELKALKYIAKELFHTCVEMQRVCILFNQANDRFIEQNADAKTKETLEQAFNIISTLRNSLELSSSINALFQIRIRVGANIGEVTIGNFGPDGAKQWDVVGLPVIVAKRMESTAPVGGLRISENFYNILEKHGVVEAYYQRFRREALALGGTFKNISREDLFKYSTVVLEDKRDAVFQTYSVQVNPGLPESISEQVHLLLDKGTDGADKILELFQYYRGNKYVVDAIEKNLAEAGVNIRKGHILELMFPKKHEAYMLKMGGDRNKVEEFIRKEYSLFTLFEKFGTYQDKVKLDRPFPGFHNNFNDFLTWFDEERNIIEARFRVKKQYALHGVYFYEIVYPLVFTSIRASLLEFQNSHGEVIEEL